MTDHCDFCAGPSPTTRYHTHPLGLTTPDYVFGDTSACTIDGLLPGYGTATRMNSEWLACDTCSQLIDVRDLTGLLTHCLTRFQESGLLADPCRNDAVTAAYHQRFRAFFHSLRYHEPWPPAP